MSKTQFKSGQRGQGMTEYIIIVALIAVAAIGVYSYFGQTIKGQATAAGAAGKAESSAAKTSTLGTYGNEQK
jgi:Flp pilus assembly pilin Flp